jgi:hypothetical protein
LVRPIFVSALEQAKQSPGHERDLKEFVLRQDSGFE